MILPFQKLFRRPVKLTIVHYIVIAVFLVSLTSMILYSPVTNQRQNVNNQYSLKYRNIPSSSLKIQSIQQQVNHGKIEIDGNGGFITCECANGTGTQSDPYIIQNYVIGSLSGSTSVSLSGNGVRIRNTNAYFVIRSVTVENFLSGTTSSSSVEGNGFLLVNVTNGNLTNDLATSNYNNGFEIQSSSNITFTNSYSTSNNHHGVVISKSSKDISLSNVTSRENIGDGFLIDSSTRITLVNSLAQGNSNYGFELEFSPGITLTSDTASGNKNYGFYFWNSPNLKTENNLSVGNIQNITFSESKAFLGYQLPNSFAGSAYNVFLFFVAVFSLVVLIILFSIIFLLYRKKKSSAKP